VEKVNLALHPRLPLVRDGFHALTISNGATHKPSLVGAVAGAIVVCPPDTHQFHVTHTIRRGTRPLHITAVPAGNIYWGEYFDNRERAAVHIYASTDSGSTWQIGYTFPPEASGTSTISFTIAGLTAYGS